MPEWLLMLYYNSKMHAPETGSSPSCPTSNENFVSIYACGVESSGIYAANLLILAKV